MDKASWFREYMRQSSANYNETADLCADQVVAASSLVASAFQQGKRLLLAGNGVDASICEIIAARFNSRLSYKAPRPGWPAISLTTNTNFLTGHSNQFGIEEIWWRLLVALGARHDILMIVESGDPHENIIWAAKKAENLGIRTIAMTGYSSKLSKLCDVIIRAPVKDHLKVNEIHMAIQNAICFLVEQELVK